jgi:hypothetical protein
MQLRTFGAISATLGSIGAGALTQAPQYQFLALPLAMVSGIVWTLLLVLFIYRNRAVIRRWVRDVFEPSHLIWAGAIGAILSLAVLFLGLIWQGYHTPPIQAAKNIQERTFTPSIGTPPLAIPPVLVDSTILRDLSRIINRELVPIQERLAEFLNNRNYNAFRFAGRSPQSFQIGPLRDDLSQTLTELENAQQKLRKFLSDNHIDSIGLQKIFDNNSGLNNMANATSNYISMMDRLKGLDASGNDAKVMPALQPLSQALSAANQEFGRWIMQTNQRIDENLAEQAKR